MMFVRGPSRKRRSGAVPVYLNVYDLTPINGYAYWLGLGVYHSGVLGEVRSTHDGPDSGDSVHGVEYAYGAHEHPTTGIFEGEPRQCPGFTFRKSILIGRTDLGPREVRALMEEMATEYTGDTYNLVSKNCNHFCDEACLRLTGKLIPKWINRLAKIGIPLPLNPQIPAFSSPKIRFFTVVSRRAPGYLCNCVLPVQVASVRQRATDEGKGGSRGGGGVEKERRTLRSNSTNSSFTTTAASSSDDPPTRISKPVVTVSSRSAASRSRRPSFSSSVGISSTLTV
ncbi:hypothetical protein BHM03_00042519 [Ensete ventricosum]|uniref:PPPDE domain-containing protein n=1 Tax=Ensete ventricosum TaxID=4639 RepID=A0A445MKF2_ENSVE|nr:hypothetical protein BHM03_00042519 [Ensete ventricosum]